MASRKYHKLDDRQWLVTAYSDRRLSLAQIAAEAGCSVSAVHGAMTRHQIPRRSRRGDQPTTLDTFGDEIVRRYVAGETAEQIGGGLGIGRQTVYNVLADRGVARRAPGERKAADLDELTLRRLYLDQRLSAPAIAREFGVSAAAVEKRLRRFGIPPRGRSLDSDERLSEANLRDMYERQRLPVKEIAAMLGISTVTLWKYLNLRGISMRTRSQVQRVKYPVAGIVRSRVIGADGYVTVSVVLSDGSVRRIAEHRHVMQEHLGRPLTEFESVHHINGDRSDNRIANLQLRSGAHGAGVVLRCNSCGSHDVSPAEIADT